MSGIYNVYLKSEHWVNFRQNTIEERGCKCEQCGATDNLVVHHKTYSNLGNEKPEDVLVLCDECHKEIHKNAHGGKARFNTYGFNNYFKYITNNINDFAESEVFVLVKLSKCIDWDTGKLIYGRKRKNVRYKDLTEIVGCSRVKIDKIIKSLKEKGILYSLKDGYYIIEDIYKGKHKKCNSQVGD